jgi:subtilase family serine protease
MLKKFFLALPFTALLLFVVLGNTTSTFAASASASSTKKLDPAHYKQVQTCAQAAKGFARCLAIELKQVGIGPHAFSSTPYGLGPNNLQNAYRLPAATAGKGKTVAIVDAYDDPSAEADLAAYRSAYGLPACTTANGCFKKVDQQDGNNYPQADSDWAGEISLDLDMVSAVCPNCHILLVEANSSSFDDLGSSVAVYDTYGNNGWNVYGGTSASSPIIASVFALAGNAKTINGSYLYSHSSSLNDVTSGNNGSCRTRYLCTAGSGYDGPTGLGTPNGTGAF